IAMLKEIGLVAELHAHHLAPERLGPKAALGERLLRRASAKVQAIDAAPAGRVQKTLQVPDRERRNRERAWLAMARIGSHQSTRLRWGCRLRLRPYGELAQIAAEAQHSRWAQPAEDLDQGRVLYRKEIRVGKLPALVAETHEVTGNLGEARRRVAGQRNLKSGRLRHQAMRCAQCGCPQRCGNGTKFSS